MNFTKARDVYKFWIRLNSEGAWVFHKKVLKSYCDILWIHFLRYLPIEVKKKTIKRKRTNEKAIKILLAISLQCSSILLSKITNWRFYFIYAHKTRFMLSLLVLILIYLILAVNNNWSKQNPALKNISRAFKIQIQNTQLKSKAQNVMNKTFVPTSHSRHITMHSRVLYASWKYSPSVPKAIALFKLISVRAFEKRLREWNITAFVSCLLSTFAFENVCVKGK